MIALAAHGLRDRFERSRQKSDQLQRQLSELALVRDRDRIAVELKDTVVQQIFAASLDLQSAGSQIADCEVRRRILAGARRLDEAISTLTRTVYDIHLPEGSLKPQPSADEQIPTA